MKNIIHNALKQAISEIGNETKWGVSFPSMIKMRP